MFKFMLSLIFISVNIIANSTSWKTPEYDEYKPYMSNSRSSFNLNLDESKTLERCTSAFLRKFLAGRSPNYSWSKTSGCKNALVNDAYSAFGTGT